MNKLLIVCGPTATGKTQLALRLAQQCNAEIVSADSRQVYKGMDIGTGKDVLKVKSQKSKVKYNYKDKEYEFVYYSVAAVKIWMYDVVSPDQEFSVAHYQFLAKRIIEDVWQRNKLPILVGGTGLYIRSLIEPITTVSIPPNQELRKNLQNKSAEELQDLVKKVSPKIWNDLNQSDRNNPRRLVRKLEIAAFNPPAKPRHGMILSEINKLTIGLRTHYPVLYERIDARVEERVRQGIIEEIKNLVSGGYNWDLPSMSGLGYRVWKPYFLNPEDTKLKQEIIQRWKWDEHAYARRQMTWFNSQRDIHWFDIANHDYLGKVETLVNGWYTRSG